MTSNPILLLLYGLCFWGSALNTPAWLRLVWRGFRNPTRGRPWWDETIMLGRVGIALASLSFCGLTGLRVRDALFEGVPLSLPLMTGVPLLALMAAADPLFLRVDELHAFESGKHSIAWRLYWIGAAAWTATIAGMWAVAL